MGKALNTRDLASQDTQKQTDDELSHVILKGKNKMPAFDGKLKKDQIGDLVAYIRKLGKAKWPACSMLNNDGQKSSS